jgi:hypothetical protein
VSYAALQTFVAAQGVDHLSARDGELREPARAALFAILARVSTDRVAYFLFNLPRLVIGLAPLLLRGPVDSIEEAKRSEDVGIGGPDFVWPLDRQWVLCADYDLTSSYLACPADVAAELTSDPGLEILPVTRATRIDDGMDLVNGKGWEALRSG